MKRGWLRRQLAQSVVVHLTTDASVAGYLETVAADGLILRAARFLDTETSLPLAGELFVPRDRIAFVQVGGPDA